MSYRSGSTPGGITQPGVAGGENTAAEIWTPAYHGFAAWNGDPALFPNGGAFATTNCWAVRVFCPKAFTLTKAAFGCTTAINTGTAAHATTVAAGSNGVDVTTFAGAGSLVVADSSTFTASGTARLACTSGSVWISYASKADGTHLSGVTTLQSGTGTLATGGAVEQSLNTIGVFNDAGTSLLGILPDQVANWASTGLQNQTLTTPNGTSAAITAGSYVWWTILSTGTAAVSMQQTNSNSTRANHGIALPQNYRVGRVNAAATFFPATITPSGLTSTGVSSAGYPWVAVT